MLDQEITRFLNDPEHIEIVRAMIHAAEGIKNRWRLFDDVYLTFQAYDSLYDGDCETGLLTILRAQFDNEGKTLPDTRGVACIYCEYAVNDVGGELCLGGFSRVDFHSAQNRLKGIFTPHASFVDIGSFITDDDARAVLTLKLLAIRA